MFMASLSEPHTPFNQSFFVALDSTSIKQITSRVKKNKGNKPNLKQK